MEHPVQDGCVFFCYDDARGRSHCACDNRTTVFCAICCIPCSAGTVTDSLGRGYMAGFCGALAGCECCIFCWARGKLRARYGLEGSTMGDACYLCIPCTAVPTVVQTVHEVCVRETVGEEEEEEEEELLP